jgi:CRISPR-associated endonuclease/helicase Cas3
VVLARQVSPVVQPPDRFRETSVVAIWLIALAHRSTDSPSNLPRRLVYVVNRRTVVDQTTSEAERLRSNLGAAGLSEPLSRLCALPFKNGDAPFAISTLRGQFADNREWSADPARPAVIIGTVDMIGSRLLFSGYGAGFKTKPLYAGFLGQNALLVHDEAHLEPAFQELLTAITDEQRRCEEFGRFDVMELSATSRGPQYPFELTTEERNPPAKLPDPPTEPLHIVWERLRAKKGLRFHPVEQRGDVAKEIGLLARLRRSSGESVLVFVRTVEDVKTVRQILTDKREGVPADQVQLLTGTLRGLERDRLVKHDPIFARLLLTAPPDGRTVYLICTSAGEVGIDTSADHMVCDLTPLDSMTQRFGRVNRRGEGAAEIDVVYETESDPKHVDKDMEKARRKTFEILRTLPICDWVERRYDASPLALLDWKLSHEERLRRAVCDYAYGWDIGDLDQRAAFTPAPMILPTSDILFDSWALTSVRDKLPGRPSVEPYLHGLSSWEPPETRVAWREEVGVITGALLALYSPEDLLDDYPLKPHELLRDTSRRVFDGLKKLKARSDTPVWIVSGDDSVRTTSLEELTSEKDPVNYKTVLLPPTAGGLENGMFNADATSADDVADDWWNEGGIRRRRRLRESDAEFDDKTKGMRLIRTIDTKPESAEEEDDGDIAPGRFWHWYELPTSGDSDGSKASNKAVAWQVHTDDVVRNVVHMVQRLALADELQHALTQAAYLHDFGKKRKLFQRILGNMNGNILLAKSGKKKQHFGLKEDYRHEFGSLLDLENETDFLELADEMKELVRHVIAAHHGRGRPHFPEDEVFDPEPKGQSLSKIAAEVPQRFARLQRKYGRWGLAYLESLLRAADYDASANPSAVEEQ